MAALLATPVLAAGQDLKSIMQDMKLAFKQAAEATTVEAMQAPISTLESLVEQAKRGVYPVEKEATYQEGFQKLAVTLDKIDAHLQVYELEAAKASLKPLMICELNTMTNAIQVFGSGCLVSLPFPSCLRAT